MSFDPDGWIPLSREMFDRYGPFVSESCRASAESATWSGEPHWGAIDVLGNIADSADGPVVDAEFLDRFEAWFLHEADASDDVDQTLMKIIGALRERADKAS